MVDYQIAPTHNVGNLLRGKVSKNGRISMLVVGVVVLVGLLMFVNRVEAICNPSAVQDELRMFRNQSMELPPFDFLTKYINSSSCLNGIKANLANRSPVNIYDFSNLCTFNPMQSGFQSDPCCSNTGCCSRRGYTIPVFEIKSLGALTCNANATFEAGLVFFPPEIRASLCSSGSIQMLIGDELKKAQNTPCAYNFNMEQYTSCRMQDPAYGDSFLPAHAKAIGLPGNSTLATVIDALKSSGALIPKCYNHLLKQNVPAASQNDCENGVAQICPFANCSNVATCFACDARDNCTEFMHDTQGNPLNQSTCTNSFKCGNNIGSQSSCDSMYMCDMACPSCNTSQGCTNSGRCDGWFWNTPICTVPFVNNNCPVNCNPNPLLGLCVCSDTSQTLSPQFNVTNNNMNAPLNAVNNKVCRVGYWELVPPRNMDECNKFRSCRYGDRGYGPIDSCSNPQSMCTNGGVAPSFNWKQGNWVKAQGQKLQWGNTTTVSPREWRWEGSNTTSIFEVAGNIMASMKNPNIFAMRNKCLVDYLDRVETFVACKCGNNEAGFCNNMTELVYLDKVIAVQANNMQGQPPSVMDTLQNGYVMVPSQIVLPNSNISFIDVLTSFKAPMYPITIFNNVSQPIGVLAGQGVSFSLPLKNIKLCLNQFYNPNPQPLSGPVGFATQINGAWRHLASIPAFIEGNSICANLDVEANVFYYPGMGQNNNNNNNHTNQMYVCNGTSANVPGVCSGFGACVGPNACQCHSGRMGSNCELPPFVCGGYPSTDSKTCGGNGKCIGPNICQCNPGRAGGNCEVLTLGPYMCFGFNSTLTTVCSGFGRCVGDNNCQCNTDRVGLSCEAKPAVNNVCSGISSTDPKVCSSGGRCIGPNNCQCNANRFGFNCENFMCFGKSVGVCSGNGACVGPDFCYCKPNFAGPDCSVCAKGFTGALCDKLLCYGVDQTQKFVCSGNGACVGPDKCACRPGATGSRCESFYCGEPGKIQCSNHGSCVGPQMCNCNATTATGFWGGANCEVCQPGYSGLKCIEKSCTAETTCLGRGTCTGNLTCACTGNFDGPYCRTCKPGFFGPFCNSSCDPLKSCNGNGICGDGGSCTCFSTNLVGMFTGSNCQTCQTGWLGSRCNVFIGPSVTFGSEGDRIRFQFAAPITTNQFDCGIMFDPATMGKLGKSPVCRWEDRANNMFLVIFGGASVLLPGDAITIQGGDVRKTLQIEGTLSLPAPVAILRAPTNISSCSSFFFDASASYSFDRRPVKFEWVISGPGSLTTVNSRLAQNTGSFGMLDASTVGTGIFTLQVTVTSSFNYTSVATATFSISSTPTMIIRLPGGNDQTIQMGTPYGIIPAVDFPSCFYPNRDLIWSWTQLSGPANAVMTLKDNNRALLLLENAFSAAGTYTFKVKAVAAASALSFYETLVSVTVVAPSLVLLIEGGYSKQFSAASPFVLDFSRSFDPGRVPGVQYFNVTCFDLINGAACSLATANLVVGGKANIPGGSLPAGQYLFTVTYTKGSRSISLDVFVSLVGFVVLNPNIRLGRFDWIPKSIPLGENIPFFVDMLGFNPANKIDFTWSSLTDGFVLGNDTTVTGINGRSLVIKGAGVAAGSSYEIRVDVNAGGSSGFAIFSFSVNSPPMPGSISATPATSAAGVDPITISMDGWYDTDTPLSYQYFFYDLTRGAWRGLSGRTTDNQIQAKLPPGFGVDKKLRIRVRVYDSKDAFSDAETSIISNPPDLTSGTAALNFLNQSSSVTDSTANSVAALSSLANIKTGQLSNEVVAQVKAFLLNVINAVLAKRAEVAVSVEDAAETISFLSSASSNLGLVDSTTRGQMLQSTAASLSALSSSSKPISGDIIDSIVNSLSSFIKNIIGGAATRSIRATSSEAQSIYDNAQTLQSAMMKSLVTDQASSVSTGTDLTTYAKKISASLSSSLSDTISSPAKFSFGSDFASAVSTSTTIGVRVKQMSNIYKLIYPQTMTILSQLFEIGVEDQDTGATIPIKGYKMYLTIGGNFTLGTTTSKYTCNVWNNSTKKFDTDSTCVISSVASDSASIEVTQTGTFALSQAVTPQATTTPQTTTVVPKKSASTKKPGVNASSSLSASFILLISILYTVICFAL